MENEYISLLPEQQDTYFDPELKEVQSKINIIAFTKYGNLDDGFPIKKFEDELQKYLTLGKFFNKRNFKSKAKGGTHLTTTHTHKGFYAYGARTTAIIRPKAHPSTNWHTIQRDFNMGVEDMHIMTLWLTQNEFDRCTREKKHMKLTLKVLDYETEAFWNRRPSKKCKMRNTVTEYTDVMVWEVRIGHLKESIQKVTSTIPKGHTQP